jgi:hypothetical protein
MGYVLLPFYVAGGEGTSGYETQRVSTGSGVFFHVLATDSRTNSIWSQVFRMLELFRGNRIHSKEIRERPRLCLKISSSPFIFVLTAYCKAPA